jgi:hypothetical protein
MRADAEVRHEQFLALLKADSFASSVSVSESPNGTAVVSIV